MVDPLRNDWHVLSVTRGGHVSILRNLPLDVARQARDRLLARIPGNRAFLQSLSQHPGNMQAANQQMQSMMIPISDGDIETVELLGPEERS